ncbi:unnamed protein product [Linum trigynum]|uniref:RVP_2 domain-containing protein n=1 Tax=Linum trigynum TaxID=586398 RepID=A0AAV2FPS8_9ROSI
MHITDGSPLECLGNLENVPLHIQGTTFPVNLHAISLSGFDIVLGVQWLATLGTVQCNWKTLELEFFWKGKIHHLNDINKDTPSKVDLKCITEEEIQLLAICIPITSEDPLRQVPPELHSLIREFGDLFEEPDQLPPQ